MRVVFFVFFYLLVLECVEFWGMWEMVVVMNFFCVFWYIINNLLEFMMDELEFVMLNFNLMLDIIYVVLLKGVLFVVRVFFCGDIWLIVLSKKFKEWWGRVVEGLCLLILC